MTPVWKSKRLLGVLAACLTVSTVPPAAAAAKAGPAQPARAACSTWQYITDSGMPIYNGAGTGTGVKDYTRSNGFVNITQFNGDWRGGNFYTDPGPVWYTSGWIHLTHIHYVRCW
ncbi:hypothetical protein [Microbispora sp. H10885]|uniref:hypothetical protein n=1 Tax=Microbispora sp. H10885 TaxID=2729110 RepID=UPI0016040CA9|nr:hypothetical protein [Microbispora sp. H10885]